MTSNSKIYSIILMMIFIVGCNKKNQTNEECLKYRNEIVYEQEIDTLAANEAFKFHDYVLNIFEEKSVKGLDYEAYHLQFYSSHRIGESIKIEKKKSGYFLTVKCKEKKGWHESCKAYQIGIEKKVWEKFEKMIYEFDFWTAEEFRSREGVLDGYAFVLEGNRPDAKKCNKKTYKLIVRGSPEYDKIGALCENMLIYEDRLMSQFEEEKLIHVY